MKLFTKISTPHVIKWSTCFFILYFCSACQPYSSTPTPSASAHFNLDRYFKEEIEKLSTQTQLRVLKSMRLNDKKSTVSIQDINWEEELSSFFKYGIHQLRDQDDYTFSTKEPEQGLKISEYQTKNRNLPIQNLTLSYKGDNLVKLVILIHIRNSIYESRETLTYQKDDFYRIEKTQKVLLFKENKFLIEGKLQLE